MKEIWRDIKVFEGAYQVSNLGRVRSLGRNIDYISRYGTIASRYYDGKIITPTDNGKGYKIVGMRNGNKKRNYYVHRLVAEAFLPNPLNLPEANHKDANRANNCLSNLEWVTRKENMRQAAARLHEPRRLSIRSKTGEKYISRRYGRYRVNIPGFIDLTYKTIEEAIAVRKTITDSEKYKTRYKNKSYEAIG